MRRSSSPTPPIERTASGNTATMYRTGGSRRFTVSLACSASTSATGLASRSRPERVANRVFRRYLRGRALNGLSSSRPNCSHRTCALREGPDAFSHQACQLESTHWSSNYGLPQSHGVHVEWCRKRRPKQSPSFPSRFQRYCPFAALGRTVLELCQHRVAKRLCQANRGTPTGTAGGSRYQDAAGVLRQI